MANSSASRTPVPSKSSKNRSAEAPEAKPAPSAVLLSVGQRIRDIRKAKGMGQDALAYSIGIDRAHIGYIENGKRAATIPTLVRLAAGLNCEVGDFFPPITDLKRLMPLD
jgi:DNA-binding XRE family transcriptional regulator